MLNLYYPGRKFIQVSITGQHCDLMCRHCGARYLKHMKPAPSPAALYEIAMDAAKNGVEGMLVSGGSDRAGKVPYKKYLNIIKKIKNETDLKINLHTGFIDETDIAGLDAADVISFDIVGSPRAARTVYGLDLAPGYFENIFDAFEDTGLNVVPHITAGLDRGKDSGEEGALETIANYNFKMMIVNSLIPKQGEKLQGHRLLSVFEIASRILPEQMRIGIGCMRPRDVDIPINRLAELRIDYFAAPSISFKKALNKNKIPYREIGGCCALASLDL
jgi:uncharacterized radical SAM superfamily protein